MYTKYYGIITTRAPLHIGASAGEETGNLNLIFRDQFTQTGIIPGSSIRGRFRADMRSKRWDWEGENPSKDSPKNSDENYWYGHQSVTGQADGGTTEALVKFEYASLVWLPVFCPGQTAVWVTCPRLLKRYQQIMGKEGKLKGKKIPKAYRASPELVNKSHVLFFNLGFLKIEDENKKEQKKKKEKKENKLADWLPEGTDIPASKLVVVDNEDMPMIHDMALYRQSRIKMRDDMKKVDTEQGAFFGVEALPEGSVLVFPMALKEAGWQPFGEKNEQEMYFGGLESIGFGRCSVTIAEVPQTSPAN